MRRQVSEINVAFITDENYIIPTATAIYSIIKNKHNDTKINIYVISKENKEDNSEEKYSVFNNSCDVSVIIKKITKNRFQALDKSDKAGICSASPAALLKFDLPNILNNLDKVLYLDGDILVDKDLSDIYQIELDDEYVAAAIDSGSIYYKHEYVRKVKNYFNSGVMLLNLKKMREDNITEKLVETKKNSTDTLLMDQNIFNIVFNGKVKLLPLTYNLLYVNLCRAKGKYSINDINEVYKTNYNTMDEILADSIILHFSSKDKPWKSMYVPMGGKWLNYYNEMNDEYGYIFEHEKEIRLNKHLDCEHPAISIIMPVYNVDKYLYSSMSSILSQGMENIELICVDDGSTDGSNAILRYFKNIDKRVKLIVQKNMGQSAARNAALRIAKGKYVYFFDSDDLLKAGGLKKMFLAAEENDVDLLVFDGDSFYETQKLANEFPQYDKYYSRRKSYSGVHNGEELYQQMVDNHDYKVSPCLQLLKKEYIERIGLNFIEGIIYEDNIFSLQAMVLANRVSHLSEKIFSRRIREGSTITQNFSYKKFRGHYICLVKMCSFVTRAELCSETVKRIDSQIKYFSKETQRMFNRLPMSEQKAPKMLDYKEESISNFIFSTLKQSSTSKTITKPDKNIAMSKIQGGIRCYREHGFKYTLKRIWQKIIMK